MGWRDIGIRENPSDELFLVFSGPAQELATQRAVTSAFVTLSHIQHHAMACIVLDG
jgi:phosphopantetheinyl transferase (holo-ACP synthase)